MMRDLPVPPSAAIAVFMSVMFWLIWLSSPLYGKKKMTVSAALVVVVVARRNPAKKQDYGEYERQEMSGFFCLFHFVFLCDVWDIRASCLESGFQALYGFFQSGNLLERV